MCQWDPSRRPTATQALQHAYFATVRTQPPLHLTPAPRGGGEASGRAARRPSGQPASAGCAAQDAPPTSGGMTRPLAEQGEGQARTAGPSVGGGAAAAGGGKDAAGSPPLDLNTLLSVLTLGGGGSSSSGGCSSDDGSSGVSGGGGVLLGAPGRRSITSLRSEARVARGSGAAQQGATPQQPQRGAHLTPRRPTGSLGGGSGGRIAASGGAVSSLLPRASSDSSGDGAAGGDGGGAAGGGALLDSFERELAALGPSPTGSREAKEGRRATARQGPPRSILQGAGLSQQQQQQQQQLPSSGAGVLPTGKLPPHRGGHDGSGLGWSGGQGAAHKTTASSGASAAGPAGWAATSHQQRSPPGASDCAAPSADALAAEAGLAPLPPGVTRYAGGVSAGQGPQPAQGPVPDAAPPPGVSLAAQRLGPIRVPAGEAASAPAAPGRNLY